MRHLKENYILLPHLLLVLLFLLYGLKILATFLASSMVFHHRQSNKEINNNTNNDFFSRKKSEKQTNKNSKLKMYIGPVLPK